MHHYFFISDMLFPTKPGNCGTAIVILENEMERYGCRNVSWRCFSAANGQNEPSRFSGRGFAAELIFRMNQGTSQGLLR